MEGIFATKADIVGLSSSSCQICGKSGHSQAKCFFSPPFYYPIFKTNGHTTMSCPKRDDSPKGEEKHQIDDKKKKKQGKKNKGRSSKNASTDNEDKEGAFLMEDCEYALTNMSTSPRRKEQDWIVDSGFTKHMTPYKRWFSTYTKLPPPIKVVTGSRAVIMATGRGNVRTRTSIGETLPLLDVLHVP